MNGQYQRVVGRVVRALMQARHWCPGYAAGPRPVPSQQVSRLAAALSLRISVHELGVPTVLLPVPGRGYRLLVAPDVHQATRDLYVLRHELGHILAGDADELISFSVDYPLPEAELVADLFAFADLIPVVRRSQPAEVEARIREIVSLDHDAWYLRVPRLAPLLPSVHQELARTSPTPRPGPRRERRRSKGVRR